MNHHGLVRKVGVEDDDEDINNSEYTGGKVLKNDWVSGSNQLHLDLVSQHEGVQVIDQTRNKTYLISFID